SVRYYGLYGHQAKAQRDRCREQLGQPPEQEPEALTWQTYWERLGRPEMGRCPVCRTKQGRSTAPHRSGGRCIARALYEV
ncbi:MAG: hypothetical protein GY731_02540, partial [Gammaproteobacteria bacterium]|nr:hypothetical protein [Gammaproteobacteria bacterium]